jgi:hypothetical protein
MLKRPVIERDRAPKTSKKQQQEQEQPEITNTPTD